MGPPGPAGNDGKDGAGSLTKAQTYVVGAASTSACDGKFCSSTVACQGPKDVLLHGFCLVIPYQQLDVGQGIQEHYADELQGQAVSNYTCFMKPAYLPGGSLSAQALCLHVP